MRSLLLAGLIASPAAFAAVPGMQWQDNSLTYLYAQHFTVDTGTQQTLTFEHASGWNWGDIFFFTDGYRFNGQRSGLHDDNTSYYGEFSPRLSASKLTGKDVSFGIVSDVLLASTYEFGEGDVNTLLLGPGFDLTLPGFDYFQLNFYKRLPRGDRDGTTYQITPAWKVTFPVGDSQIIVDGYIDWVVNDDKTYSHNLHINPQIKYDLGPALNIAKNKLLVGIEYDYWQNKYGIANTQDFRTTQNVTNLIVKYHF